MRTLSPCSLLVIALSLRTDLDKGRGPRSRRTAGAGEPRRIPSDAGERRLAVAIAAQRDRVRDPVVGRVAVDVMDLQRHVGPAAVAAAAPVDGERAASQLLQLPAAWATGLVLAAVGARAESAADQAGSLHNQPTSRVGCGRFSSRKIAIAGVDLVRSIQLYKAKLRQSPRLFARSAHRAQATGCASGAATPRRWRPSPARWHLGR